MGDFLLYHFRLSLRSTFCIFIKFPALLSHRLFLYHMFLSLFRRKSLECLQEVLLQVLEPLDSYAYPYQPMVNTGIRHRPPLNQTLHAAQTRRVVE